MKMDSNEEVKKPRTNTEFISNSVNQRKYKNMIPGFSIIKNRIITPLLIASEKVVEYMIPESYSKISSKNPSGAVENQITELTNDNQDIDDKFSKMSLEDIERHNRKRTMKSLSKTTKTIKISKGLMNKASDWVDYISDQMPVESKVTRNFVTNMIELSDSALKRIAASCKDIDDSGENINMRFIKPSKKFYNILMSVWIKLDTTSIFNLTEEEFTDHVKQALENEVVIWSDAFLEPTKTFYNVAKEEFMNMYQSQRDDASDLEVEPNNFIFSVTRFFTSMKSSLYEMWNSEIVNKSTKFTSAWATNETEGIDEESEDVTKNL
jgi:hypothetical protein